MHAGSLPRPEDVGELVATNANGAPYDKAALAQRLIRYADIVGNQNILAGTGCGIGYRVEHESVAWGKFQSLTEGARIASERLWGIDSALQRQQKRGLLMAALFFRVTTMTI